METSITMELDAYLCEVFQSEDHDIRSYSSLSLAFIGDCVYDLMIKSLIIRKGNRPVNAMQKRDEPTCAGVRPVFYDACYARASHGGGTRCLPKRP